MVSFLLCGLIGLKSLIYIKLEISFLLCKKKFEEMRIDVFFFTVREEQTQGQ